MKLLVAILLMAIAACTCREQVHDNGQPGCKTNIELTVVNYRNTWDPTRYWVCRVLGQPAAEAKCPGGTGWLDSQKKCVDWEVWEWEWPVPPPSKP